MEWYRWFPSLYADDTLHLTLEQDAIYRRLIDWYMVGRMPLPTEAIALARICQISLEKFQENESVMQKFFIKRGGKYHLKRCDIELDRQDGTSKKLGDAARKAHEARKINKENQEDISLGNAKAIALPTIEERRGEVEDKESKSEKTNFLENQIMFEAFWQAYPKKTRKGFALKSYKSAMERTSHENLMNALGKYKFPSEEKYCPKPEDWLDGDCWMDGTIKTDLTEKELWIIRLDGWKNKKLWIDNWGPNPDSADCIPLKQKRA